MKAVLFGLSLYGMALGGCGPGCLSCAVSGSSSQCSVCDVELGYQLGSSGCEISKIENCLQLSSVFGQCAVCSTGYFLVPNEGRCQAVESTISNCVEQDSASTCGICAPGFFVQEGKCEAVATKITGCVQYGLGGTRCERCARGVLSRNRSACEAVDVSLDLNCTLRLFPLRCDTCVDGKRVGGGRMQATVGGAKEAWLRLARHRPASQVELGQVATCEAGTATSGGGDSGCVGPMASTACFSCPRGQYFDEKTGGCVANPSASPQGGASLINDCYVLDDSLNCRVCLEGFFLHYSHRRCVAHSQRAEACRIMSQRIDSACLLCEDSHFLDSGQLCQPRTHLVQNCSEFSVLADRCRVCLSDFLIGPSGLVCHPSPINCIKPQVSDEAAECEVCAEGFVLAEGGCVAATAELPENCAVGSATGGCKECQQGFTLVNSLCVRGDGELKGCARSADGSACQTCEAGTFAFTARAVCSAVTPIEGCEEPLPSGRCQRCSEGYFLDSDSGACRVGNEPNCAVFASAKSAVERENSPRCLACLGGYYLFNGYCHFAGSLKGNTAGCLQYGANGNCVLCGEGRTYYTEFVSRVSQTCIASRTLPDQPHCAVFEEDATGAPSTPVCQNCRPGFFLNPDGNCMSCVGSQCAFVDGPWRAKLDSSGCAVASSQGHCLQFGPSAVPQFVPSILVIEDAEWGLIGREGFKKVKLAVPNSASRDSQKVGRFSALLFATAGDLTGGNPVDVTCVAGRTHSSDAQGSQADCGKKVRHCESEAAVLFRNTTYRLFSECYDCSNGLAVYRTESPIRFSDFGFDLTSYVFKGDFNDYVPRTFCAPISASNTNGGISNCLAFAIKMTGTDLKIECYECRPGFSELRDSNGKIVECPKLLHCERSRRAGECERCERGYQLRPDGGCETATVPGCSRGDGVNCLECTAGQRLQAGRCWPALVDGCATYEGEFCTRCLERTEAVLRVLERGLSGSVSCQSGGAASLPCILKDWNGLCVLCSGGYQAGIFGECFSTTRVPNCIRYNPLNHRCARCLPGFILLEASDVCELPGPAAKCSGTSIAINSGAAALCIESPISNCDLLDPASLAQSSLDCLVCAPGYRRVALGASHLRCLVPPSAAHCLLLDTLPGPKMECAACEAGYFVDSHGECKSQDPVQTCLRYLQKSRGCAECAGGYFLSDGICQRRVNVYSDCVEYFIDADDCLRFAKEFHDEDLFLINTAPPRQFSGSEGRSFEGVLGCVIYRSSTICIRCSNDSFLQDNECVGVSSRISGCEFYLADGVCGGCEDGNFLVDKTCLPITAENCLVYSSPTQCLFCPPALPLLSPDSRKCLPGISVENCETYRSATHCATCLSGFYLKNNECAKILRPIDNCTSYDPQQKCVKCAAGYTPYLGLCEPTPTFDPDCVSYSQSSYECVLCKEGYVMANGQCLPCLGIQKECSLCSSPTGQTCLLCRSGYYMDETGTCLLNTSVSKQTSQVRVQIE